MEVGSLAAGYDGSIRINTKLDRNGFNQGLNAIAGSLKKLGGAMGIAFGVTAMVKFGKEALNIASDLTEVQNVVETAFGAMTSQVDAWAKNSIQQFGMSELAAKRTASTYMAMNAGMGLVGQGAANMAMEVAGRTADIASFFNTSQEEADTMLKSIWTGETESLKRIGVVMTQTNLDAYALANGFGKTTQQMTQSEQVMLRYQYVMNQTRLAAGDFVKTQDSWANQTRILSEQWKQFLGIVGQGLIQVLTPALKFLNQMMGVLIQWAQTFSAVTAAIFGKQQAQANASAAAVGNVADASNSAADGQNALASATKKAGKEAKGALASFDQLNVLERSTADAGAASGTGAAADSMPAVAVPALEGEIGAGVTISPDLQRAIDTIGNMFTPWKSAWSGYGSSIIASLQSALGNIGALAQGIGSTIASWWASDHGQSFANTTLEMFQKIASAADRITQAILNIWNNGGSEVFYNLMTLGGNIVEIIEIIIGYIAETYADLVEWFAPDAESALGGINDKISSANSFLEWLKTDGKPILEVLGTTIGIVTAAWLGYKAVMLAVNIATKAWDLICKGIQKTNWIMLAISAVVAIIIVCIRHWDEIKAVAIACWNKIKEAWNKAGDWFHKNVTEPVSNFFTGMWDGIKKTFRMAVDWIKKVFTSSVNSWISIIESFINFFIKGLNVLIRGVNKLSFDIPEWFPVGGGTTFGFNIPTIPNVQIPRLAQGAVIPPNQQFAAILGDQTHGRNLEAPEGLIRQIVREELGNVYSPVLNAINNSNIGKKAVIMGDVYMDSQKVGRVVARPVFREGNRAGYIKVKV
nr:MAG TPA: minor tail protein [Caudoviricetes sp.]